MATETFDITDVDSLLDMASTLLYQRMNTLTTDTQNPAIRKAHNTYSIAIQKIAHARVAAKEAIALVENSTVGVVEFVGNDDKACWLGMVGGKFVMCRTSALAAGETLIIRTVDGSKRILVKSYGDAIRNPPYVTLG